jgi:phosphatidylglycerol:prolipoprotein diacylglycerol transferase
MYVGLYSIARIIAEFYRQPDIQLGFIFNTSWLTMGMLISGIFIVCATILYFIVSTRIKIEDK